MKRNNPFSNQPVNNQPNQAQPPKHNAPFANVASSPFQNTGYNQEVESQAQNLPRTRPTPSNVFQNQPRFPTTSSRNVERSEFDLAKEEWETSLKQFNCSDQYIKPTAYVLPNTQNLLHQLSFPIGLSISPVSSTAGEEIPLVSYEDKTIPRCPNTQCRAYLNPFVKFIEGGEKWICNFCKQVNNTEDHYYANLDKNGRRVDCDTKIELCHGSYEFLTNKQYWSSGKTPTTAMHIFLIETSMSAITNGFLTSVIESIKDVVNNGSFYNGTITKCIFITYDSTVHFYKCSKTCQPQMLCVADEPVFLPTTKESLILDLVNDKDQILSILDMIQNSFTTNSCKDSTKIFSALNGAYLLGKGLGAKITIFSSSNTLSTLPKMIGGTDPKMTKEQLSYSCHDKRQIGVMGINLTNDKMSVDIFVTAENPINLLTLNQLCEYSNGSIYFYKNFRIELHYKNIFNQIRRVLTRPIAWEGVLRTRFSHGYKIVEFLTPTLLSNRDLFNFPTNDSDQHYQVGIDMDKANGDDTQNLTVNDNFVYIQSAFLYSYGDGSRRIRIHNLCLPVSNKPTDIYESIDGEALATYYLKSTIDKIYKTKNISNAIISTETLFKTFISSMMSQQQSMKKELSDNLVYLPLYILGIIKHRLFCKDEIEKKYDIDLSNYLRIKLQRTSIEETMYFIFPHIYQLNQLIYDKEIGKINEETGESKMPNLVSTHSEALEEDGVYLIDNGYLLIFYVRRGANVAFLKSLFGVEDLQFLAMTVNEETVFAEMDELKERIMNIIDCIRR